MLIAALDLIFNIYRVVQEAKKRGMFTRRGTETRRTLCAGAATWIAVAVAIVLGIAALALSR